MPVRKRLAVTWAVKATVVLVGYCAIARAQEDDAHRFKLTIDGKLKSQVQSATQNIETTTETQYTWRRRNDELDLTYHSMDIKALQDGKQIMNSRMSRARYLSEGGGREFDISFDDASAQLKQLMTDSFESPLCTIVVDKEGRELKRTITAGKGARLHLENGSIVNARLFHAPFPADKGQWEAPSEISLGNGGYVRGNLNYAISKAATNKESSDGDLVAVKVTGTLTNKEFKAPNGAIIKNALYEVAGKQHFRPAWREWHSGKLHFDISYDLFSADQMIGSASGTLVVTLQEVPKPARDE